MHNNKKWVDRKISICTGSQKLVLMESIGLLELETLGAEELRKDFSLPEVESVLWKGGFPELWANQQINSELFLDDYSDTKSYGLP